MDGKAPPSELSTAPQQRIDPLDITTSHGLNDMYLSMRDEFIRVNQSLDAIDAKDDEEEEYEDSQPYSQPRDNLPPVTTGDPQRRVTRSASKRERTTRAAAASPAPTSAATRVVGSPRKKRKQSNNNKTRTRQEDPLALKSSSDEADAHDGEQQPLSPAQGEYILTH
jgi:hypothetical protein